MQHPRAGQQARSEDIVDIPRLVTAYYTRHPDPEDPRHRVAFGTNGHRGCAFDATFTDDHVAAISQAVADYRTTHGTNGPLFLGADTHALSEPARITALEVLAANGLTVMVDADGGHTPTPAVSHAVLAHNKGRRTGHADAMVITPSHNPPTDGGIKYNATHGGPAGTRATTWIQKRANALLADGLRDVHRTPHSRALTAGNVLPYDFLTHYTHDLPAVVDLEAARQAGIRIGADPLGGAALAYWHRIAEHHRLDLTVLGPPPDPTWRSMRLDQDGRIRMDPSSPHTMAGLLERRDDFHLTVANDADADRYGVITPDGGLVPPNHYLAAACAYLHAHRTAWPDSAGIGKSLVTSALIDRIASDLGRPLIEAPVGFKWFVDGLTNGDLCCAGEESAGMSFLRRDGSVWTTDKDGIVPALLAAEMTAVTASSPSQAYASLTKRFGQPTYARTDVPATPHQKAVLSALTPRQVSKTRIAGEDVLSVLTATRGGNTPFGGLKVSTPNAWFAARPSGTEDVYKIYAESFLGPEHLLRVQEEATAAVNTALESA